MGEVVIKTRENGPLLVTGDFTLVDHCGRKFDLRGQPNTALCRCGSSRKRPFCDGSHRHNGFQAGELAPQPPTETAPPA